MEGKVRKGRGYELLALKMEQRVAQGMGCGHLPEAVKAKENDSFPLESLHGMQPADLF